MKTLSIPQLVLACSVLSVGGSAWAADKTGQEVVEQYCAACHVTGKDGAPQIGDAKAWLTRTPKGLAKLAENAISGIGKMPAHGGQPSLTDLEISRAIAYMVSAGMAKDPNKPFASPTTITAEALVQERCITCHGDGKSGAPQMGSLVDWKPRLGKGMNALVDSAIKGHNAMPARAGMNQLSDTDLRSTVMYLVVQSVTFQVSKK